MSNKNRVDFNKNRKTKNKNDKNKNDENKNDKNEGINTVKEVDNKREIRKYEDLFETDIRYNNY